MTISFAKELFSHFIIRLSLPKWNLWWNFTWFGIFFRRHQTEEFPKRDSSHFCATFQIYTLFGVQVACLLQRNNLNSHCIKYFQRESGIWVAIFNDCISKSLLHYTCMPLAVIHVKTNYYFLTRFVWLLNQIGWRFIQGGSLICSINRAVILFHLLYTYPDLVCVEFNTRFKYRTQKTPYMTQY